MLVDVSHLVEEEAEYQPIFCSGVCFTGLARVDSIMEPKRSSSQQRLQHLGKTAKEASSRPFLKSMLSAFESAFLRKNEVDLAHIIQDLFQRERRERKGRKEL